jgi:sugar-specific transcriptional regulator TrmB
MEHLQEDFQILNLTKAEEKILLGLLEIGTSTVSSLARKADVPRTTAYSALMRLKDRGLVRRRYKGHLRGRWNIVQLESVKKAMHRTLTTFGSDRDKVGESFEGKLTEKAAESVEINIHRGIRNMLRVYESVVREHNNTHISAIQTSESMSSQIEKVSPEAFAWFNDQVSKNGLILDKVLPKEVKQLYREVMRSLPRWGGHLGGASTTVLIEDEYLRGNLETVLIQDIVLLVNWEDEFLVYIRNPDIAHSFSNFFALLKDTGYMFDINAFTKQLVESEINE